MGTIVVPFIERTVRSSVVKRGFMTRTVSTRAGDLHVYDAPGHGDLPCMVVLHGISASATGFAPLFVRLRAKAKRIVVPDYPGHGFSGDPKVPLTFDALLESVTEALDELLGDEPFVLVGNSLGGVVAVDYAIKRAERCRGLVLLSPAGAKSSEEDWSALVRSFHIKTRQDAMAFMRRVYHRLPLIAHVIAHELPANIARRGVQDLFGSVTHEDSASAEDLAKLTMPILFSWGMSERLLPDAHLAWWRANLPKHAIIERPTGQGHCPHFDAPAELAARIVSFLRA